MTLAILLGQLSTFQYMTFKTIPKPIFLILVLSIFWFQKVEAQNSELFYRTYSSQGELNSPTLVIVLHGDSPFRTPSYQYAIARIIAKENSNVVTAGILRPGYTDEEGNTSPGIRGNTTGDNYTQEVMDAINRVTQNLVEKHKPSKILLVGHSGGAAISANLLSRYPKTYNSAVLISCPCDLPPWRKHMKSLQPNSNIWDEDVDSLSPMEEIGGIDEQAQIVLIHGDKDEVVPMKIARNYNSKLKAEGKRAKLIQLENQPHDIAFNPKVFQVVSQLVK